MLGLSKCVEDGFVLVDLLVKLSLQLLLRHTNQEVADQLGNGLSNCANGDLEDSIDTCSDLLYEDVCASRLASWLLLLLLLLLSWNRLAVLVVLRWHSVFLRHDRGAVFLVISVVDEHIVLLSVDHSFDQFTSVVTLALQHLANDVHNLGAQGWAPHENALDNRRSKSFELCVAILDELKCWVTKLVKLW